ncbi:MAG TPA: proline iminopeptidase-family hydrolase [Jatrophihabitans sp.]|nr:proline iminopeptidase-family hydrolase [Jatrophihabitans sp.]
MDATRSVTTGQMPFADGHTWYRITGELAADTGRAPLVVVHGGPGAAHNYCLAMQELADDGRAVIHYDQFGCGNSSHRPDWDPSRWTVQLFVDELAALVDRLGIRNSYHLLGQSWGGMLGPEYVLQHPQGIRSLTICDSPASMALWIEAANTLRAQLPADVQQTLAEHELAGTTDSAAYRAATAVFYNRHVCRVVPNPPDVAATFNQLDDDPTVYQAMNGPNEFHVIGSLKNWTVVDRLAGISVPTLVVAGEFDEAMPPVWQPFLDRIPGARSQVFPDASHMPHVEQPEQFRQVVGDFLREHDPH